MVQKVNMDKVGFFLSILCAVHCIAMPFLLTLLPLLGSGLLHNSALELTLVGSTIVIASALLVKDYVQNHKNLLPLALLAAGCLVKLLALFVFNEAYEPVAITSGAAFIGLAYVANWRLKAHHKTCKC